MTSPAASPAEPIRAVIQATDELAAALSPAQLRLVGETYLFIGQRLIDAADLLTD